MSGLNDFHTHYRAAGDTSQPIGWQILRDGEPVDLTDLTPTWKLTDVAGDDVIAETADGLAVDAPTQGKISIDLPAEAVDEDLIPAGANSAEFYLWVYLTDGEEERETVPPDGRRRKLLLSRSS